MTSQKALQIIKNEIYADGKEHPEANNEMIALVMVRDKYYSCWTFEGFLKQAAKIERVTE